MKSVHGVVPGANRRSDPLVAANRCAVRVTAAQLGIWDRLGAVDQQHKELLFPVDLLHEALQEGREAHAVSQLIGLLSDYTKSHFAEEERMMAEAGYQQLPQHQALRRALEAKVAAFRKRADAGERLGASEVTEFTGNWLTEHIAKVDLAYLPALRRSGRVLDLERAA